MTNDEYRQLYDEFTEGKKELKTIESLNED